MPKLSIITINYNNLEGLQRTVESVIKQTSKDFEYLIIDGGSTDGGAAYIKSKSSHFDYWISEADSGIYNAMNKGIKVSNGEYLLFLNSGDVLVDDENILNICTKKLTGDIIAFDCFLERNNKIVGRRTHVEKPTLFYVYKRGLKHQSTFISRKLFDNNGLYDENYKIAADYEFWIRSFLKPNLDAAGLPVALTVYKLGGLSEVVGWGDEFNQIQQELLPHLIADFRYFEKLLPYQNSRILTMIINIQKLFRKIFS